MLLVLHEVCIYHNLDANTITDDVFDKTMDYAKTVLLPYIMRHRQ